jgi:phospholipid transport system substrate-binding protein
MPVRSILAALALSVLMTFAVSAAADPAPDARAFVERTNAAIGTLLKEPASAARTTRIEAALDSLIDFDEVARGAVSGAGLSEAQRVEVRDLLRRWVGRRYVGKLARAADYLVAYTDPTAVSPQAWRVRVELRSATDPREPTVQIDYLVRWATGAFKVTDILTEGSSLTKNCHDAFALILGPSRDGYAALVRQLQGSPVATSAFQ